MEVLEANFAGTETDYGDIFSFEPAPFVREREELLPLPPLPVPLAAEAQAAIESDSLEIADEALNAAASKYRPGSGKKASESRSWAAAFGLALLIHAGFIAACVFVALAYNLLHPQLALTQGAGSSESGIVADDATETTSQGGGIAGPKLVMPDLPKPLKINLHSEANDTASEPDIAPTPTLQTTAAELEAPLDPVLIGVATDLSGPTPVWRHPTVQNSPTAAPVSSGNSATNTAPPSRVVRATHVFAAPRGAGGIARGNKGSGLDSRGLPVPEYPPESRQRHEEGIVKFEVRVKSDGSVGYIKLTKDSGFPRLNDAAFASLRAARFIPATDDGNPIATTVIVPYQFVLR